MNTPKQSNSQNPLRENMYNIKIAGIPEHNAFIDERTRQNLQLSENAALRNEIKAINESLQEQLKDTKKSAKHANLRSWLSVGIAAASLVVSFLALFL